MIRSKIPKFAAFFVLGFLYIPIFILIVNSFNASRFPNVWNGFTLDWYRNLFDQPAIWIALGNSITVALASTCLATALGALSALSIFRYRSKLQTFHEALLYAPLVVPEIHLGISLLLFFVYTGLKGGLFAIFLAHGTLCTGYVTMVLLNHLETFDFAAIEAARDLGASPRQVFARIALPLFTPALVSGALLAFTLSLDDFIVSFFVKGPTSMTLPIYIFSMMKHGSPPLMNALSSLVIFTSFALVFVSRRLIQRSLP